MGLRVRVIGVAVQRSRGSVHGDQGVLDPHDLLGLHTHVLRLARYREIQGDIGEI